MGLARIETLDGEPLDANGEERADTPDETTSSSRRQMHKESLASTLNVAEPSDSTSDWDHDGIGLLADMLADTGEDEEEHAIFADEYEGTVLVDEKESLDEPSGATSAPHEIPQMKTSASPTFLTDYYQNSRLHHLSMWREELRMHAARLMAEKRANRANRAETQPPQPPQSSQKPRCVMHVDLDCFFVSVSLLSQPMELRDLPVAVSHARNDSSVVSDSSSDISSCNYAARAFGIRNGMYIREAMQRCPQLQLIPYDFDGYRRVAQCFYHVLAEIADELQAVSCDEAYLDVSSLMDRADTDDPHALARDIRAKIKAACQVDASIGSGPNMLIARLATKRAKPCGQFHVAAGDVAAFMATQSLEDVPGVGHALAAKLEAMGHRTCVDLLNTPLDELQSALGQRLGRSLYDKIRGQDDRRVSSDSDRKSVGSEVSWGVRFASVAQCRRFLEEMCEEVWQRMVEAFPEQRVDQIRPQRIQLKLHRRQFGAGESQKRLGRGACDVFHRSRTVSRGLADGAVFGRETWTLFETELLRSLQTAIEDVRGVGVFLSDFFCNQQRPSKRDHHDLLVGLTRQHADARTLPRHESVDAQTWSELPEDIRQELSQPQAQVQWKRQQSDEKSHSTHKHTETKRAKHGRPSAMSTKTLAQLWGRQASRETKQLPGAAAQLSAVQLRDAIAQLPAEQYDPQVVLALPPELQQEIIQQWRQTETEQTVGERLPIVLSGRSDWTSVQFCAFLRHALADCDQVHRQLADIDEALVQLVMHQCLHLVNESCRILRESHREDCTSIVDKVGRLAKDLFDVELSAWHVGVDRK